MFNPCVLTGKRCISLFEIRSKSSNFTYYENFTPIEFFDHSKDAIGLAQSIASTETRSAVTAEQEKKQSKKNIKRNRKNSTLNERGADWLDGIGIVTGFLWTCSLPFRVFIEHSKRVATILLGKLTKNLDDTIEPWGIFDYLKNAHARYCHILNYKTQAGRLLINLIRSIIMWYI